MNKSIKKTSIVIFVSVTIVLFVLRCISIPKHFLQQDRYGELFRDFIYKDYYTVVKNGTSPVYGVLLKLLSNIGFSEAICFITINILSQLYILIMGIIIINKIEIVNKWIKKYITFLFTYLILESHLFMYGFNDMLLGTVVITTIYNVLYNDNRFVFFKLGALLGIALSIRVTGVFLIFFIIYKFYLNHNNFKGTFRVFCLFLLPLFFIISIIHYPSIKEYKKLSFHSKEPPREVTWIQRNTLGLKKLLKGETKSYGNNSIWQETKFPEVIEYIERNGEKSLPRNIIELVYKEPIVFSFITVRNVLYEFLWIVRFSGFLFLFVICSSIPVLKNRGAILLLIITFLLAAASGSFFEARWFTGYKILLFISALIGLSKSKLSLNKQDAIFISTLMLITIFNIKTIYSICSYL